MAKEQPVASGRTGRPAIEQEGTERRDAGTRPDHDDRRLLVLWKAEAVSLLYIDLQLISRLDAFGEEGRGKAEPLALADHVAHAVDRQRQFARRRVVRRRD